MISREHEPFSLKQDLKYIWWLPTGVWVRLILQRPPPRKELLPANTNDAIAGRLPLIETPPPTPTRRCSCCLFVCLFLFIFRCCLVASRPCPRYVIFTWLQTNFHSKGRHPLLKHLYFLIIIIIFFVVVDTVTPIIINIVIIAIITVTTNIIIIIIHNFLVIPFIIIISITITLSKLLLFSSLLFHYYCSYCYQYYCYHYVRDWYWTDT